MMKIKVNKIIMAAIICATAIFINSCGDKITNFDGVTPVTEGARVKFLHAFQGGPPIVVFVNGKKWSAVLNSSANGPDSLVYGGVFPQIDYSVLPAGATNFDLKSTSSANPAGAVLGSASIPLENGKYYTVIAADTAPTPRFVTITDDRSVIKNDTKTYLRFVNVLSGAPASGYDFILRRLGVSTLLGTLKYGEASAVNEVDPIAVGSIVNDSLFIRLPGSTTNFITVNFTGSTSTILAPNRLRTYILRGKVAAPGINVITNN